MSSPVWSGHITFGLISIPSRLHVAARSQGISFNMLHRTDLSRIKQQLMCPADNRVVDRSEIVKGYEFRKGEYIVIEPDEIKAIEPTSSKEIEILEFVEEEEVDPVYFDSSYYIIPEQAGIKAYSLLTKAMQLGMYYGVAKVFMHNREYTAIIRSSGDTLMLHTMYYHQEIHDESRFKVGDYDDIKEVEAAMKLIVAMSEPWVPEKYFDGFMEDMKQLIQSKLEGTKIKKEKKVKKQTLPDIMTALKSSMAEVDAKKVRK